MSDPRTDLVSRLLANDLVDWPMLDDARGGLAEQAFGGSGWTASLDADQSDWRIDAILDLFQAMEQLNLTEPAFPWNRGGLLADLGRDADAGIAFLEAARRLSDAIARGDLAEPDDRGWAETARANAARCLLNAGRTVMAAVLWQELKDEDYRAEFQERLNNTVTNESGIEREAIVWVPHPLWISSSSQREKAVTNS